jgi:diguanylate cyclase (GGDEF)-like protein
LQVTLQAWGYDVEVARDGTEAWAILDSEFPPSIAILDWMMPGYTGPDLCRRIRERASESYTYILLLTSRNEREDVVAGLDSGADDYLTKPFDQHELRVRLRAGRRIVDLQQQLLSTREEMRIQATHDYLTGLWNRSAVIGVLDRELARCAREDSWLGVVLADLDHFKSINDSYGHCAGDAALRESARRMRDSLRTYDSIGRYGGEEFLAVLPGADLDACAALGERMRSQIREHNLVFRGAQITLSSSFGCTAVHAGSSSVEELIKVADDALYAAKRAGRNRIVSRACPDSDVTKGSALTYASQG